MKRELPCACRFTLTIIILAFCSFTTYGQLTGNKTIPGDYSTISAAVTALNTAGVGAGGVTFNVAANYTETITATISITATGAAANPILFQKDPGTAGANPVITAYTTGIGTPATPVQDGIWRFVGSDYVTIDGIDVSDNAANISNPATMEYGYALYKAGTSNGCQFVTIKNCVITLNNINNAPGTAPMADGSVGIIVMNATATAAVTVLTPVAGGTNSNNQFYSNTIQNCNTGIALIGYAAVTPFTLADANNDVGGSAALTGNTIINFGGAAGATMPSAAIRTLAQYDINISYNVINSNNGSGVNHPEVLRGIYTNTATSANATITHNTITLKGGGTIQHLYGIENASGSTAAGNTINISNNTVTNSTYTTATTGGFYGIRNTAGPATLTMSGNTVSNNSSAATTTGFFYGLLNSGTSTTVTMSGNIVSGNSTGALTTGLFIGMYNSTIVSNLTISSNTIAGNATTSASGAYYAIYNAASVTTAINIDANNIGNGTTPAFTFNGANSGAQIFINNTGGAATAAVSISNNNIQGITYAVAGTGNTTCISNTATSRSQAINGNTFTNLAVNTTGNMVFIANSVVVSATGTQNVNNNSIVGTFTKAAGGTVTLFTSSATSVAGAVVNNNNNNFSNITVTGATIIAGWVNTDGGAATKTIQNNTFSNWTGGTGAITAMSVNLTGTNNATTGNIINTLSGGATIVGIATGSGNDKIYGNTIHTLVSTGVLSTIVSGISVTSGTVKNIYQNTIYNLQGNGITTGSVRGIVTSGGSTINIYQNTVYSLQANAITSGFLSGIWVATATNIGVYSNKIYDLSSSANAISTGIVSGIQVSGSTANSTITIRNNLIGDLRTPSASTTDPVRGISLVSNGAVSTINAYNNSIYLNAASSGVNFGSTGIYHLTSTTATTATLDLRNNIIINTSVSNGTGFSVAYRRSSNSLTNYSASSNNNLFYAGMPAANRLLYYDVTNSDQFLSTYKTRVGSRDAQSVTEDMITASKFISTSGAFVSFLHIDPTKATQAESGGIAIAGVTTDIDGQIIQGNTGYAGTGTAPDIGADETDGIRISAFSGTYNVGAGQTFTSLTNADGLFANINSRGLSGNVVINITSDLTEDGTNVLYQWIEQGIGNYTVTIQPDASAVRVISGNVVAGMMRLNGADRVTIDGRNSGSGVYLTFRNTNTAGTTGTAFTFINGAANNTIRYCNIEAYANATNGVVLLSTSTVAGGNSNNVISYCNINATVSGNTGNVGIYAAGTIGKENAANTISSNNIYNYRDRGLDVSAVGSTAWNISGNSFYNGGISGAINYGAASTLHGIRILGGAGYSILNNYIGGSASLASGANAIYSSTAGNVAYQGILLTTTGATPASNIKGNTVAAITVSSVPTAASSTAFIGIETNGSGINIGGSSPGDGNTIGAATGNSSIVVSTVTAATTSTSLIRGIYCNSTGGLVVGNQVGGIDIQNTGAAPAASSLIGIYVSHITAASQVNNNIVGIAAVTNSIRVLSTSTATATSLTGILIATSVTSSVLVDGNIVQNLSNLTTVNTTGPIIGIGSGAATATANVTISNNTISSLLATVFSVGTGTPTSSYFIGINNTGAAGTVRINNNIIKGFATNSTAGNFNGIRNTGAVINTIQINNNQMGTGATPAITFNAASSGSQIFINNTGGAATASLTISTNNFQGVNYAVAGTGANTFILNSAATLSQAINGNTFTALNVNASGSVTFISNSVIVPSGGTQNVNNNSIVTSFTKRAGNTVTFFTSTASSAAGSVINNNSNNFSSITVTGATVIAGWVNTDAGASLKTISGNTFSNWSGGTSAVTALSVNITGTGNATTDNLISNIQSAGAITAISSGAGNDNINANTINGLATTGASAVTGIAVTAGTTKNIFRNKIYDLQSSAATGSVSGILVSGGTTVNVYNNLVGDLRSPAANSTTDLVRAISITSAVVSSAVNIYYNTVYLNATSTGTNFSSSGIYHVASATATTAALDLRNNSITNTSTPKGSGVTAAYRRSGIALNNYAASSNNNLFYGGTPGIGRSVFYDGTNSDQTIAAFKTRVATRDAQSVTENLTIKFLSTTGSSSLFLHMDAAQPTIVESGAVNITGFTDDFDAQIRAGNTGYTGSGTLPDIGADEVFGIEIVPPTITYTPLTDTTSTVNRDITGISITDASGINNNAGTNPRIYFKRYTDANVWLDNTSSTNGWKYTEATNTTSPYTFTINYSLLYGGPEVTAGVIQYFIVAQDRSTTANVAINSGTFNTTPASVALAAIRFPIGGTINSYNIPFSGNYNIGTGEVFTSLTKADGLFASINSAGMMGNTIFNIVSDITEDGANALNQWTESGAGNYTVTIQPDAATRRTISGNVVGGLIRLNGADRVTIDGSYSGDGSYLSFKNTNTAGTTGTAFTFINGAANNTIKYTDIEAYTNATNAVILFSTSTIAGGNSNNLIDNCTINATVSSNTGNVAIYAAGTVGNENASNTISNNTIHGYRDRGLDITATGSTAWNISGNSFYSGDITGSINYAASSVLHGLRVLGGSGYSIMNNYIGGREALASGANAIYSSTLGNLSYEGILLTTSSASPASYISGNTIAAISLSSVPTAANSTAFTGIQTNGAGINIGGIAAGEGNKIGSNVSNASITVTTSTTATTNTSLITGINCASTDGLIIGNLVGGIDISNIGSSPAASSFTGLFINSAAAPSTVSKNIIGSDITPNSIRVLSISSATTTSLSGISVGSAVNSDILLDENLIENFGQLSTTSSGTFTGISNNASSGLLTISNDTIQNVLTAANANAGSGVYTGIYSSAATSITNSLITNISLLSTGPNAQVMGINISGVSGNTISGNLISAFSTGSGRVTANAETDSPAGSAIIGILNSSSGAGQIISNNRFAQFNATSSAAVNVMVTGVGITSSGSGNIYNNRFGTMTNLATGGGAAICHINASNGSFNVYNNTLRISNLLNTNTVKIYGIIHASATGWNYYHNTVRVGGSSYGAAIRSAAFLLSGSSSPVLKDNIFFNIRTGTGYHYAVSNLGSPPSNWSASASDYNDFYSINPNTVAEWGSSTNKTFTEWQSLTGGDVHSISNAISFITSPYDLEPDSVTNCNFNNTGIPITTPVLINTDLRGNPRDSGHPDMGSYEFHYTGFSIIAGSNSPVCAGDSLLLTVNPGNALIPSFSWSNPANIVISASQHPTVTLIAGQYKITISDSTGCYVTDSTLVSIHQRPAATITSVTSVCDSGFVNLNISVTGTGLISGTLSNGDNFSGTAPLIIVPVFITTTASFSITDLSDGSCAAIITDIPDTITVVVTQKGDWLGITSNWSDPANWCEGVVPTPSTDVTIPAGTSIMPIITDSVHCNSLLINTGDTLTIAGTGILNISGTLTNFGTYIDNGTTTFNGISGQQTFSGITTFNNLTLNNASGLLLPTAITVKANMLLSVGILNANNFNIAVNGNWTNNFSTTAFTGGTASVTFNGTTDQTINGVVATTFNNLVLTNTTSTVTLNVNTSVTGNLSVSGGIFDLAGFTANRASAGGVLTVSNNATLKIGGTNTYPANYTINSLMAASTVEYSGTNQTVDNQSYGNLKLSSSAGAAIKTFPTTALAVLGNLNSVPGAGSSVSFTSASNITVGGNVSIGASTTFNSGSFLHSLGGNWLNNGTFNGNTGTITFMGTGAVVSGSGTQNFNNLTVAASGVSFSTGSISLTGNLVSTGAGSFSQSSGGTLSMTGSAKTISGSGISLDNLAVSGAVSTTASVNLTGNLSVNGSLIASAGTITMSGTSKTISGTGTMGFAVLSVTGAVTTDADFSISSVLTVNGSFSASAGTATFTGVSTLSGVANLYNITINGTKLQLASNSGLGIANIFTIMAGTLDATTSSPNTVNFNGTGAQNVNGITYCNLVLSNGNTKTAVDSITTTYDILIATGTTFNPSSFTHSVYGNWINNGTFIPGTSTIQFLGPATAYLSGVTSFNILTSNTSSSSTVLILQNNISAVIVNMINGVIQTGTNTLTITGTRTGNGFIQGNIQRTHAFTTGVPYAFEGPDNTITFSAVSAVGSITVSVKEGSISDFPFGSSISREYNITVPAGTYTATLRLHYEDDELNGNDESLMNLWNYNGSAWGSIGKTGNSTTSNYIEQSGLTNISDRWTCSGASNLVRWNGSVSTDWNTAANWTVLQGAGSRPPSSSDIVDLGSATFINQPVINNTVTVKNIIFGSAKAVTLTLNSGGSLTTLGDINGNWTANATHTINVNNQSLTVNGNIGLSDGTSGHAIDVNIGTGTVTTLGSLLETGGANINFSGAGTLSIFRDFIHSSGTFTAGSGTVIYDGTENQDVAHINYNNVIINKPAGIATIDTVVTIAGNLLISSGQLDNFSTTTIIGNVTISTGATLQNGSILHVGGNWDNSGNFTGAGINIIFDGPGTQTISASTFNNLEINKPVGSLAVLTGDIILNGNLAGTSGTLDIKSFFFNRLVVGGSATIADSATLIIAADNAPNKFANYYLAPNSTVIFDGTGTQHLLLPGVAYGNLSFSNAGLKILYTPITVNGNLKIESGASFDGGSNTITLNGNWINNGTFIPSASTLLCAGIAKTVSGITTFNRVTVTGSYALLNNVTFNTLLNITSTGTLSAGGTIVTTMNGDLINSGILYSLGTSTFTGNTLQTLSLINSVQTVALIVNFNGSVSPVLNSTSAPQFGYININNTGGVNPSTGWTILYALAVGSGASFNGGASTHNILGAVTNNGIITSSGILNFIPSSAKTINIGSIFSSTGTVVFGGAGAITLAGTPVSLHDVVIANTNSAGLTPSSDWNLTNNFTVNSGSIFHAGNHSYLVGGNISNAGTINSGSSTFILIGTAAQNISTVSPFNNLTINKAAGSAVLSSNTTVNSILNFVAGKIQTAGNILIQPSSGTVTGAAQNTGWVNGKFQKNIATGATGKTFEIGDIASFTPVSLAFSNLTTAGNLTASTTQGDHPNISSSIINTDKSVNRFWTLVNNNGIVFTDYAATLNFVAADIDAGASTSSFDVALYNGSSWVLPATALPNATNIQAITVTTFGDFAIGETCYKGTTIAYPSSPYCTNAGTASVILTGAGGGTYSSTAGLSINAGTGAINLSSSTPGAYVITYTIGATSGCRSYLTTANINISGAASAIISYAGSPYCSGAGTASITFSGTSGGTYSSAAGLSMNATTGDIILASSTAGAYTVTYMVAATGGCSQYQVTTNVTISDPSSATINYTGSPFCSSAGTATVTHTGTTGGVYSSATGLSIDAATGSIITGTSTQGNYTVTYTVAAANGCGQFTTTTSVTITALPSAIISYSGSPFCNLPGTTSVTLTGTGGGTYSSTTGLSINGISGDINIGTSTAGTYTVTYTLFADGGCGQYTTTTTITIAVPGTWTGAVSNEWNTAENWLCGFIPVFTTNVTIPASLSTYPVISSGVSAIGNLTMQSGATLTVTDAVIQISGSISNSGIFTVSNGTVEMNGTSAQTIPVAAFAGKKINNLTINNTAGVTLTDTLKLIHTLTVSNGVLTTGGFLVLKSSDTATAVVSRITSAAGTPISGNVIVERYIPGRRKYRLITSAVTTSTSPTLTAGQENLSIWGNWQNSGINTIPNVGELVTGGSAADGFDQGTTNASLYTYNDATRSFVGYTSANGKNTKYTPLKAGIAYLMFVYGDRQNSVFATNPHNTVLSATGTLETGDQVYNISSAIPLAGVSGRFTLLGNPFASPIDWATIPKTGLANSYWGWDPNLSSTGGYITVTTLGNVTIQAPYSGSTGLNQYIQSGQGIFVKTTGPSPVLTIREQDKVSNFNGNAFRTSQIGDPLPLLAINLQYVSNSATILADGVLAAFDPAFPNATGAEDATKMVNTAESMAILNDNTALSIDARQMPQNNDTIFLNVSGLTKPQYNLQIFAEQLERADVKAYLQDRYLNTLQLLSLSDTNNIVINVSAGIPASSDINRFRIVFHSSVMALPVKFISIAATKKNKDIQIDWAVGDESGIKRYEIEKFADGSNFNKAGEVTASGSNGAKSYHWLDITPITGNNYYRIRAVQSDGKSLLSNIVVVKINFVSTVFNVFPNPVTNHQLNIRANQMAKGKYTLLLFNQQGQQIIKRIIDHKGGAFNQIIELSKILSSGIYYLQITGEKEKYDQNIFLE